MTAETQQIIETIKSYIVTHQHELELLGIGYVIGVILKENALLILLVFIVIVAWSLS